ncbi:MAG: HAMP domain-containing sensor histidine kinase [Pseudomonadota bacterium]
MKTLTLRIYLTVVAMVLLFAMASAWVFQRHIDSERGRADNIIVDRMEAWGDLIQRSLPPANAPVREQADALRDWSQRLSVPLALDAENGRRIAVSDTYARRQRNGLTVPFEIRLSDGRVLWVLRPGLARRQAAAAQRAAEAKAEGRATAGTGRADANEEEGSDANASANAASRARMHPPLRGPVIPWLAGPDASPWQRGVSLGVVLMLLFVAVAAGTWPVVRALTRRLKVLKQGAERFGAGELSHRVQINGNDEVAAVAASFNEAAGRIETLVRAHQSLLANASHELRSPLARMKMAVSFLDDAAPAQREALKKEIHTNIAELDELVEEVLLASRLDAVNPPPLSDLVDLRALAIEALARLDGECPTTLQAAPEPLHVIGDERLLRRALRNLLENARRYGGGQIDLVVQAHANEAQVQVCDRGEGVPEAQRERIFEAFYRLPGHAEKAGGVGLGLSLVKQIAARHQGQVRCDARPGGGSCFVFTMPRALM